MVQLSRLNWGGSAVQSVASLKTTWVARVAWGCRWVVAVWAAGVRCQWLLPSTCTLGLFRMLFIYVDVIRALDEGCRLRWRLVRSTAVM